jgi:hypothetical protein
MAKLISTIRAISVFIMASPTRGAGPGTLANEGNARIRCHFARFKRRVVGGQPQC